MNTKLRMTLLDSRTSLLVAAVIIIALGAAFISNPQAVEAKTSELSQEIIPDGCDSDTYLTGQGVIHDPACPVFSPVISSFERTANGRFRVFGAYDAVHTDIDPVTGVYRLVVLFAGRAFQLGVNPELTVNGNAWMLDVADWRDDPEINGIDTTIPTQSVVKTKVTSTMGSQDGGASRDDLSFETTITAPNQQLDMTKIVQEPVVAGVEGSCLEPTGIYISPWLLGVIVAGLIAETLFLLWLAFLGLRNRRKTEDEN